MDCIPEHTFKYAQVCQFQPFFPNIKAHHHFLPPPKKAVVVSASFLYLPLKLPSWIAWKKKVSVSLYSIFLLPVFTTWDIFKFRYTDDFLGTIENGGSQTLVLIRISGELVENANFQPCPRDLNLVALEGRNMLCQPASQVMECRWFMDCILMAIILALSGPLINCGQVYEYMNSYIYECIWKLSWHLYFCQQRLLPITTGTYSPRRFINPSSPSPLSSCFQWLMKSYCGCISLFSCIGPLHLLGYHCASGSPIWWLVNRYPGIQVLFTPTQLLNHNSPQPMLVCIEDLTQATFPLSLPLRSSLIILVSFLSLFFMHSHLSIFVHDIPSMDRKRLTQQAWLVQTLHLPKKWIAFISSMVSCWEITSELLTFSSSEVFLYAYCLGLYYVVVVQSLSHVWLFVILWTVACQAPLSSTVSWSLLKLMSIESVMLSYHLFLHWPPSFAFSLFQHLSLFQWVGSLHQVLELQLQHQSFQWIFRVDFH